MQDATEMGCRACLALSLPLPGKCAFAAPSVCGKDATATWRVQLLLKPRAVRAPRLRLRSAAGAGCFRWRSVQCSGPWAVRTCPRSLRQLRHGGDMSAESALTAPESATTVVAAPVSAVLMSPVVAEHAPSVGSSMRVRLPSPSPSPLQRPSSLQGA
jgi:hypothetical protein